MFGGTAANAYMLVYRQRKLGNEAGNQKPQIPDYWAKEIKEVNAKGEVYRKEYE